MDTTKNGEAAMDDEHMNDDALWDEAPDAEEVSPGAADAGQKSKRGAAERHVQVSNVGGDLRVRGGDEGELFAKGDQVNLNEGGVGEVDSVTAAGNLKLFVPYNTDLDVLTVGGDAKITDVVGRITVSNTGSDLILRDINTALVGVVSGDLRVKDSRGSIKVENVSSSASLRDVAGNVLIQNVSGDATLRSIGGSVAVTNVSADVFIRDVGGDCIVENAGGDLVLHLDFAAGQTYRFNAGGDILCGIAEDANVRFKVQCGGSLEYDDVEAEVIEGEETTDLVFGEGAAQVMLIAGGDVRVVNQDGSFGIRFDVNVTDEIQAQIDAHLSGLDEMINSQVERAMRQAERAMRQAERQVDRVMRHVEDRRKKRRSVRFSTVASTERSRPTEAVSNEERMVILRMVEAKQISVAEAEKLLAALEGRTASDE